MLSRLADNLLNLPFPFIAVLCNPAMSLRCSLLSGCNYFHHCMMLNLLAQSSASLCCPCSNHFYLPFLTGCKPQHFSSSALFLSVNDILHLSDVTHFSCVQLYHLLLLLCRPGVDAMYVITWYNVTLRNLTALHLCKVFIGALTSVQKSLRSMMQPKN